LGRVSCLGSTVQHGADGAARCSTVQTVQHGARTLSARFAVRSNEVNNEDEDEGE